MKAYIIEWLLKMCRPKVVLRENQHFRCEGLTVERLLLSRGSSTTTIWMVVFWGRRRWQTLSVVSGGLRCSSRRWCSWVVSVVYLQKFAFGQWSPRKFSRTSQKHDRHPVEISLSETPRSLPEINIPHFSCGEIRFNTILVRNIIRALSRTLSTCVNDRHVLQNNIKSKRK